MALHFTSTLPSFNRQFATTKAQLSETSYSVNPTSLPTANKWKIAQENQPLPFTNHVCPSFASLSAYICIYVCMRARMKSTDRNLTLIIRD